ncbi:hypothetical protein HDU76_005497 [Blyttiomyces sp. JEL0837]|nr:hypothetical protein HDU76_005497 [Blyttiomyces sp. JEL0837]
MPLLILQPRSTRAPKKITTTTTTTTATATVQQQETQTRRRSSRAGAASRSFEPSVPAAPGPQRDVDDDTASDSHQRRATTVARDDGRNSRGTRGAVKKTLEMGPPPPTPFGNPHDPNSAKVYEPRENSSSAGTRLTYAGRRRQLAIPEESPTHEESMAMFGNGF